MKKEFAVSDNSGIYSAYSHSVLTEIQKLRLLTSPILSMSLGPKLISVRQIALFTFLCNEFYSLIFHFFLPVSPGEASSGKLFDWDTGVSYSR